MNVKRLMIWFWLMIKKTLRTPVMAVLLAAMPIAACGVRFAQSDIWKGIADADEIKSSAVAVIYTEDDDELARIATDSLCSGDTSVRYIYVPDKDTFYEKIKSGKADFGYIIRENLSGRLDEKSYRGAIKLVAEESSYITSISNEIVFSRIFEAYAEQIAVNYVGTIEEADALREQIAASVRENFDEFMDNEDLSYFRFETLNDSGGTSELEPDGTSFPLRGILGVMVMVAAMAGGVSYCSDRNGGMFNSLTRRAGYVGAVVYVTVPTVLFALSAELALMIMNEADASVELVKMPAYVLLLIIINVVLALIVRDASMFAGAIPVFVVTSLVFCPIFFNLTAAVPAIRCLNYLLPVSYYL